MGCAVPLLTRAVEQGGYVAVTNAVDSLGCIGSVARPALPAIKAAAGRKYEIQYQSDNIQAMAREAIPKIER